MVKLLIESFFRKLTGYITRNYAVCRIWFLILCDLIITFSSIMGAIFIYTRLIHAAHPWPIIFMATFLMFAVKFILFRLFNIYDISFQHASMLYAVKTSSIIFAGAVAGYFLLKLIIPVYWRGVIAALYVLIDIVASVSFRFLPLVYHEVYNKLKEEEKSCIIYGGGYTGRSLITILAQSDIKMKGFIDDDYRKVNKIIAGFKVLGRFHDLEKILTKTKIDILVIAIPSLDGMKIKAVKDICSKLNIEIKIIPSLYQMYNSRTEGISDSIQDISYEDLIRRPVRKENFSMLNDFFKAKSIIVTGAGSIGSELVNQLIRFGVENMVVLDNCEFNLFKLEDSLDKDHLKKIKFKLADLKNKHLLEKILAESSPDIVFHTAAYKHVPIVEQNMHEGIFNNLLCVQNIYQASRKYGVSNFIFISSDKAVRPTNIMGATKRLGELYLQAMSVLGGMVSSSVRFGNVMGSSGSLVPKIISQVQKNKPVTITHPQAQRFFMLTSEAVLLILKASAIARGGEIFILDMGKPLKIVDIAKDIISFYGKMPGVDIPIEYIGLRPGEKLFEELILDGVEKQTYKDEMYIAYPQPFNSQNFIEDYEKIIYLARDIDNDGEILSLIKKYVKIYSNDEFSNNVMCQRSKV